MRSARKRAGLYMGALLVALALIALAIFVGGVIDTHREQHGHGVAVGPGAQGGEAQVVVVDDHGLNCSGMNGASA